MGLELALRLREERGRHDALDDGAAFGGEGGGDVGAAGGGLEARDRHAPC